VAADNYDMKIEWIESWIDKVVQQRHHRARPKRPLDYDNDNDDGIALESKRPRHHYPTPESDNQEEHEQTRQCRDIRVKEQGQELEYTQSPTTVARRATRTALMADMEVVNDANAEQTPRAPRLMSLNILSTAASPVSSASTTTTSDSGATKRSYWSNRSSPSKRAVLSSLIQPITFPVLVKDAVPPNATAGVRQLYDRLRQFERSQGVFPAVEKVKRYGKIQTSRLTNTLVSISSSARALSILTSIFPMYTLTTPTTVRPWAVSPP
jgi:hypothetical protein